MTTTSTTRPGRAAPLAAGWLGLWGVLAMVGTLTGHGYPLGANDAYGEASLLRLLPVRYGPPVFAVVLLGAAVAALAMVGTARPSRPLRGLLLAYGWAVAVLLAVVVPDVRVLMILAYLPMLIIGAPFGWPPVDYAEIFNWTLAAKFSGLVAGVLLAAAVLAWQRRTAGSCVACGRDGDEAGWTTPAAAARWGRWAAWSAAAIPLVYAATRFAWVLGIPLGLSREFLTEMHDNGLVWAGAGLGAFATVGAVLTIGLVRRWGEVFPRWLPRLGGRRVPPLLAVVPGTLVAIAVTAGSLGELANSDFWQMAGGFSSANAPMLLWPLWGPALGAATLAYHLRRRGACASCRRPWPGPVARA
ncbi:hypothetical protein [Micromonospora eburnea]|uniref:Uncharacterized protein n=1 Tax=Micromonospora eburnea TaxID=227316 RepID=A0A1C6TUP8_9ACTN|nr:hypothetical protein [Micromonospora eburnea]SCL45409.1 hypothetical protein GA0070604_0947 [Micromonospora eburnea]